MDFFVLAGFSTEGAIIGGIVGGLIGLCLTLPLLIKQYKINKGIAKAKPGYRHREMISYNGDKDLLDSKIKEYLSLKNYVGQNYGDEYIYRNGKGILTASKIFKYELTDEFVKIEAFIIAFGAKETALTGAVGMLPKKQLKQIVDGVIEIIKASN